jgi:hypothetical protein
MKTMQMFYISTMLMRKVFLSPIKITKVVTNDENMK